MLPPSHVAVRLINAAYDLESPPQPWMRGLLESGKAMFDQGLGCAAVAVTGQTRNGVPLVSRFVTHGNASNGLALALVRASQCLHGLSATTVTDRSTSVVRTLSSVSSDRPRLHHAVRSRVGCEDALCLVAVDSQLHGVLLLTPTHERIHLTPKAQRRWRALAWHIGVADRLRRALGPSTLERLRQAAARLDAESRGGAEARTTPTLEVLRDIVDGKLSTIDGFVSNGRCFTLARPNDPCLGDPRALTAQEKKVLLHTARGERRKLVANHVGISRSGVSRVLGSGMRKLGVRSQSELAMKVRCLERYGLLDPQ